MSLAYKIAGKIEDLSKKYPNLDIREVANNDPSNTKKYLSWMVKQLDQGVSKEDLYPSINLFHNLSQRNQLQGSSKNIESYLSLKELEDSLKVISEESNREARKKIKEQMKSVSGLPHIIFENDKFAVTRIDTRTESIILGEGTSWCITMSNANYFDYYKANNVEFYFAILKEQIKYKAYKKLAFDFQRDFDKNIIKETIWLASDEANENITSQMIEYYGDDLPKAFEKCKADAALQPNGLIFKLINDPNATVKDYLEYKKNAESAADGNMGEINNDKIFEKIKKECKSKELIKYFEDEVRKKIKNKEEIDWGDISYNQKLSEDFIREFADKVNWYNISSSQKLSEEFIREFSDKVDWCYISRFQKLSEDFIREFSDKVSWYNISYRQKLSEEFIKKFVDKVNWEYISHSQKLSEEFIREFADKLNASKLLNNNNLDNYLKEKIKLHFNDWVAEAKSKNKEAKLQFICNIFYKKSYKIS